MDVMERSITYTRAEYLRLPNKYAQVRAVCGFVQSVYQAEHTNHLVKALYGNPS